MCCGWKWAPPLAACPVKTRKWSRKLAAESFKCCSWKNEATWRAQAAEEPSPSRVALHVTLVCSCNSERHSIWISNSAQPRGSSSFFNETWQTKASLRTKSTIEIWKSLAISDASNTAGCTLELIFYLNRYLSRKSAVAHGLLPSQIHQRSDLRCASLLAASSDGCTCVAVCCGALQCISASHLWHCACAHGMYGLTKLERQILPAGLSRIWMLWFHHDARDKGEVTAIFYWSTLIDAPECMKSHRYRRHVTTATFLTIQWRRRPATRWWPHGLAPRCSTRQHLSWSRSGHLSCRAQGNLTRRRDAAFPRARCPARRRIFFLALSLLLPS